MGNRCSCVIGTHELNGTRNSYGKRTPSTVQSPPCLPPAIGMATERRNTIATERCVRVPKWGHRGRCRRIADDALCVFLILALRRRRAFYRRVGLVGALARRVSPSGCPIRMGVGEGHLCGGRGLRLEGLRLEGLAFVYRGYRGECRCVSGN